MKKESKKAAFRAGSLGVAWLLGYTESWESQTECAGATVARGGKDLA
jgi:hypothetical protein